MPEEVLLNAGALRLALLNVPAECPIVLIVDDGVLDLEPVATVTREYGYPGDQLGYIVLRDVASAAKK